MMSGLNINLLHADHPVGPTRPSNPARAHLSPDRVAVLVRRGLYRARSAPSGSMPHPALHRHATGPIMAGEP